MLKDKVVEAANAAVETRFKLRDQALAKELDALAQKIQSGGFDDEEERMGVQLRLICEQDLETRAQSAWGAIKKAHQSLDGKRTEDLASELMGLLNDAMKRGAVSLANHLRERHTALSQALGGATPVDAQYLTRQWQRAADDRRSDVGAYVSKLRKPLRFGFGR